MTRPDSPITIGIDFDDTLWHTTPHFGRGREILGRIFESVSGGVSASELVRSIEESHITTYGFGYASFVLAGIEALLATDGNARDLAIIEPLLNWAHDTSSAPVELLGGVEETLPVLASKYQLIGITRGSIPTQVDLFLRSGLGGYFGEIEVLGKKTVGRYESILRRNRIAPDRFIMIGNSITADIEPALAAGGYAIHIPYGEGWDQRRDQETDAESSIRPNPRWSRIESFSEVPATVDALVARW